MLQIMGANAKNLDFCPDFSKSIFPLRNQREIPSNFNKYLFFTLFQMLIFLPKNQRGVNAPLPPNDVPGSIRYYSSL